MLRCAVYTDRRAREPAGASAPLREPGPGAGARAGPTDTRARIIRYVLRYLKVRVSSLSAAAAGASVVARAPAAISGALTAESHCALPSPGFQPSTCLYWLLLHSSYICAPQLGPGPCKVRSPGCAAFPVGFRDSETVLRPQCTGTAVHVQTY